MYAIVENLYLKTDIDRDEVEVTTLLTVLSMSLGTLILGLLVTVNIIISV